MTIKNQIRTNSISLPNRMARTIKYCLILCAIAFSMQICYGTNVITKDIGTVSFYERDWTIQFNLNLKSYVENALILRNTTNKLMDICATLQNEQNCKYFRKAIEINTDIVTRELTRITKHRRAKRGFWIIAAQAAITQLIVAVGTIAVVEVVHKDRVDELEAKAEFLEAKIARQHRIQVLQNGMIETLSNDTMTYQINSAVLNKTAYDRNKFIDLVNIATQSMIKHNMDTAKFINIIRGDFRSNFFNIVDLDEFMDKMKSANESLGTNGYLPTSNPFDALDVSELTYFINDTHITIHTKLLILIHKPIILSEYIPIPIKLNNELFILNSDAKFYFLDQKNITKAISTQYFADCKSIDNHIICNSLILEMAHNLDDCMHVIIHREQENQCTYRQIDYHNYLIRLEPQVVYCAIVHPIKLRITCGENTKEYDLKSDEKINFSDQCDIYSISNDFRYDGETMSQTEINTPLHKPNFSVYDLTNNTWSHHIFIDKCMQNIHYELEKFKEIKSKNIFHSEGMNISTF